MFTESFFEEPKIVFYGITFIVLWRLKKVLDVALSVLQILV